MRPPEITRRGAGWAWRRAASRYPSLTTLRAALARSYASATGGVKPGNLVWIFGTGRGGSTWLRSMMGELPGHAVWEEPLVGKLFGEFYEWSQSGQKGSKNFILGAPTRDGWTRSVRSFVLDGARYAHPLLGPKHYLVVKEPNGSAGALLLMEALPESRMIFLTRDPRDVISSTLDAAREGSWLYEWTDRGRWREENIADRDPDAFVKMRAGIYVQQLGNAKRAYDAHAGPKVMVRYEDLRARTLEEMKRIYPALGIPAKDADLARSVERHSWENIPEAEKGAGKVYRKAKPGGWREDLTPGQAGIVERVTAPLLEELYPE